ncbi:MAG: Uncharacterized protein JWR11_1776 [Mycobacterium sp.]|nr:Uncharacterized protein [Mycobacterium sp.]
MSQRPQDPPESAGAYPPGWVPVGPPSPPRSGRLWWIIAAVVLAVIVVVGAVAVSTGRGSRTAGAPYSPQPTPGSTQKASTAAPTSIASAADTGPVGLITSDETCGPWDNVQTSVAAAVKNGWAQRDPALPASGWEPARRSQFEAVGSALRSGADTAVTLAARTPHRAMRELYDAFAVYGRAYADSSPNYEPRDDFLAQTSLAALDSITEICAAARSISAMPEPPAVPPAPPPSEPVVAEPADVQRFLAEPNPTCARWVPSEATVREQTADWSALDPNIGVAQWNPAQRAVADAAAQVMAARADDMEAAGRDSGNPVVEDLATLGALYLRAFAMEEPLYWTGDHDLADVGLAVDHLVSTACQAVGG